MKCEKCGCEHDGTYGSGRFCTSGCARSFATREKRGEINAKVREKLRGRTPKGGAPFAKGGDSRRGWARAPTPSFEEAPRIGEAHGRVLSTDERGLIAEAAFEFLALTAKLILHRPVNPQLKYDFLAGDKKVQVKMSWRDGKAYEVSLSKRRHTANGFVWRGYKSGDFDLLAVFNEDERDFWIVPAEIALARTGIRFWTTPAKNVRGFDSSVFWKRWDLFER